VKKIHDYIRRYVYINNDIPDKANITCSVRYYNIKHKKPLKYDWQDIKYYEHLKFTMTDFL
jgi:hypothetical protein